MKTEKMARAISIVLIFLGLCGTVLGELPEYFVMDLGTLDNYGQVWGINDSEQIVGGIQPGNGQAFVWDRIYGKTNLIPSNSYAHSINNSGQAVGRARTSTQQNGQRYDHAYLWETDGTAVDLGALFINGWADSRAFDINDSGVVVGKSYSSSGWQAFIWDSNNGMVGLTEGSAFGINNTGRVVGYSGDQGGITHAFIWDSTNGVVDLGTLGGEDSRAFAINDLGQVVGESDAYPDAYGYHAFLWDQTGGMVDLGTLGGTGSVAVSINDSGQIVGHSDTDVPSETHAFLWDSVNGLIDLHDLVLEDAGFSRVSRATGINNRGQIIGYGEVGQESHAFLISPITTYHVDGATGSNSNDGLSRASAFATIQFAIDKAEVVDGDTVLVWPGVYNESSTFGVNFKGKAITVKSAADAAVIEVDGFTAVRFALGEGADSVLSNFVIRGSYYGIIASFSDPTISNVTVVNNTNGIVADNADPIITNCIFWNNTNGDLIGIPDPITAQYSFVQDDLVDDIIAYWKFDDKSGTTAYDAIGDNHGAVNGAEWTTGQVEGALTFNGVHDHVSIPDSDVFDFGTGDFSISAWFKTSDTSIRPGNFIIDFKQADNDPHVEIYVITGTGIIGTHVLPENERIEYSGNVHDGIWHHVVITMDNGATNGYKLYLDNVLRGQRTFSSSLSNWDTLTIGHRQPPDHYNSFDGEIDEVIVFNRSLSAVEIEEIYQKGLIGDRFAVNPLFADPDNDDYHLLSERGRYRATTDEWILDDVTSLCVDAGDPAVAPSGEPMPCGGRVNMGAYGNSPTASMSEWEIEADLDYDGSVDAGDMGIFSGEWLEQLMFADEPTGSALEFDGVDDYVEVPYKEDFQISVLTIMGWVYPTTDLSTNTTTCSIVTRGEDVVNDRQHFGLGVRHADSSWGQGVGVGYETDNDDDYTYSTGWYPPVEEWTHLAATRAVDGQLAIYANGEVIGQWQATPTPTSICQQDLTIGASKGNPSGTIGGFFPGLIDEVTIHKKALSEEEIQTLMRSRPDIADPNLVGYWDLEEGAGQVAADKSGNGNDGQLGSTGTDDSSDPVWVDSEVPGVTYYVDGATGSNGNDGLTWDSAFATIQKGINTAEDCDTVLVAAGVYYESLYVMDKQITIESADEPAVIDGGFDDAAALYSWQGKEATLKNFIIRNGYAGVYVGDGTPQLANLTIVDCYTGIEAEAGAEPDITSCILADNDYDLWNCTAGNSFVEEDSEANLVANWQLDEITGATAYDRIGSYNGTLLGGLSFDVDSTPGQIEYALHLDGSNDRIYSDSFSLPRDAFTMSLWFNPDLTMDNNSDRMELIHWQTLQRPHLTFNKEGDGTIRLHVKVDGQAYEDVKTQTTSWTTSTWYNIAVIFDGTNFSIYVNGDLENTVAHPGTNDSTSGIYLGSHRNNGDLSFDGKLDDVRIYDRALSSEEIVAIYEVGLAGHEYGPLFADAGSGDYRLLSERGRYRATTDEWVLDDVTSPCVDGGDAYGALGDERMPNGGRVNMGAYGGTSQASMSEWPLAGDLDLDGIVDMADFAGIARLWMIQEEWKN